ncbi:probable mitochondrial import inner membrane translocase subunit TIM21 [Zingiber officinale]|uniref:probable mitochondrial import inner membrane translocase subunit TIM21 n=1 Tax=Zingiber officinale TaxID=94328 RepID=UPI001C4BA2B2|nr:probable mitochondrial import inner membrane translocase subunit TIM21 [Zingiber officinale]
MASRVLSGFARRTAARRLIPPSSRPEAIGNRSVGLPSAKESALGSLANSSFKDIVNAEEKIAKFSRWQLVNRNPAGQPNIYKRNPGIFPCLARTCASNYSTSEQKRSEESRKDISTIEDPFDAPTYNIPEKPVTFTEGASYSLVILAGLGVAGVAAYAVFKELIFEPKEYKIFGKALERVQNDSRVTVRIGHPVTGYGQESRNRAARQRIPNRVWTDEAGIEHVEVSFHIRGPNGFGKVYAEMFKNQAEKEWIFTYLIVEIKSPSPAQLMLESYVPA